jgi:hypothetical protein
MLLPDSQYVDHSRFVSNILGTIGATIGGLLGYFVFVWLVSRGLYGMIIPGAFLGLGCSLFARHHSILRGAFCGVAALFLGFYTEWRVFPGDDTSLNHFIAHLHNRGAVTWIMILLGAGIAAWLGKDSGFSFRRTRPVPPTTPV